MDNYESLGSPEQGWKIQDFSKHIKYGVICSFGILSLTIFILFCVDIHDNIHGIYKISHNQNELLLDIQRIMNSTKNEEFNFSQLSTQINHK